MVSGKSKQSSAKMSDMTVTIWDPNMEMPFYLIFTLKVSYKSILILLNKQYLIFTLNKQNTNERCYTIKYE